MKTKVAKIFGFALLLLLVGFWGLGANAQSVIDPSDPVITYNSSAPPTQPAYGQMGKWVRTKRLNWNTDSYKCYIWKGFPFRIKFPKSYTTANDGKKYPILVFYHGVGEGNQGNIYDNEFQLYHGGQIFAAAVDNGQFDGFIIAGQSMSSWGGNGFPFIAEIIDYLIANNKVDPFRVINNGLSGGGQACWLSANLFPTYYAAVMPMSSAELTFKGSDYINKLKFTPIWNFQGGLDGSPTPGAAREVRDAYLAAGSNYSYTEYPNLSHGVWNTVWQEPGFWPFVSKANKANPWPLFGKAEFCPGETISTTLGLTPGMSEYQWKKGDDVIPGATSNTLQVTQLGTYSARVRRGSNWSDWSPVPVVVKMKDPTVPPSIVVSGLQSKVLPALDEEGGVTLSVPTGYANYLWQKVDNATTLSTTNTYKATAAGNYKVRVTEVYGCNSEFSSPFTVIDANGPNKPDPAGNLIVSTISKTSLRLDWSENPNPQFNETNFEVYQASQASGPYTLVAMKDANVITHTITGLNAGSTYYYKVRAVNATGAASASNVATGKTDFDQIPPAAPQNLRIVSSTRNSIALAWSAATDDVGVDKYDIYINGQKSYVTNDTTFVVYSLTTGQSYNFTVKARDLADNTSPFSNQVTGQALLKGLTYKYYTFTGTWNNLPNFTTLTPVATGVMPTVALTPRTQDDNFAFLWEGYINIPVSGNYYFRTNSDDGSRLWLGPLNGTTSPYSFSGTPTVNNDGLHGTQDATSSVKNLAAGTYPIAIAFYEQGGGEAMTVSWRTPSSGTSYSVIPASAFADAPVNNGSAPVAPSNIAASAVSFKQINVSWTDNSNNESGFEIWRSTDQMTGFVTVGTVGANATSFVDSVGLQASTTYYYNVRAIGQYGESAFGAIGSGVDYKYYEIDGMSAVPAFTTANPKKTGRTTNFNIAMADRADNFAVWLSGYINITKAGTYTFYTSSDDGSVLYIGGTSTSNRVVNNDGLHGNTEKSGTKTLAVGMYPIYVGFFEAGGDQILTVSYKGPSGSGIAKQVIPASVLGMPLPNATTQALPPVPAAPSNLLASGASTSRINVTWNDNSTNETGFELYRSNNGNANYVLYTKLPANTTSFVDTGLFANAIHYYKLRAVGVGGNSAYTAEDSAKTDNNIPVLAAISNQTMRYGTQLQINVQATDLDPETLDIQVTNLPGFATYTPTGNGTGVITFNNPTALQQGAYNNITIQVTDQHSGFSSLSFNMLVNDNYLPAIGTVNNLSVNEQQTTQVTLTATDQNAADVLTWSFVGLPSFVTVDQTSGQAQLTVAPGYADNGVYNVTATVNDGNGGQDVKSFSITVNNVNPNRKIYVSFNDGTNQAAAPWNNTNKNNPALGDKFLSLKDETGATSTVSLEITSNWLGIGNGSNTLGVNTGNNSGVYPDPVMISAYYTTTTPQTIRISGLGAGKKANFTFFGSRAGVTDNRTSVYTINGNSVSLNAASNSRNTVSLNNMVADASGNLTLTLSAGSGAAYGYLNAMVIETVFDDGTAPVKARDLSAAMNNNAVQLNWIDAAYNENGYEVYRATNIAGPYTLINTGATNIIDQTQYNDQTVTGSTTYYYTVRAINLAGAAPYSDTVSIAVPNVAPQLTVPATVNMKTQQTVSANISATDEPGDAITLSVSNLPAFATFTSNGGNGSIQFAPGNVTGSFDITVTATDSHGASTSKVVSLTILDKDITKIMVNFNAVLPVASPWNSFNVTPLAGRTLANMVDNAGTATSVGITLVDGWDDANNVGAVTGNNSGVFPDDVMQTAYWTASASAKRVRLTGLSTAPGIKYNLVFFGSRAGANDNRNTVYSYAGQSVTLNAASNTRNTVQVTGVTPNASGEIEFTVQKGTGSAYAYLNALVVESYFDNGIPLAPTNLVALAKSKTAIQLNWSDKSSGEDGFEIYRSTSQSSGYQLLYTTATNVTAYEDATPTPGTIYYYKVRAKKSPEFSDYSNIAATSTLDNAVYINFNADSPAGTPWNNTNAAPIEDDVYANLKDESSNPTGINMAVVGKGFSGINTGGMNTGNNSGVYPDNVIKQTWWLDISGTGILKIDGLNQAKTYNFTFFASRDVGGASVDRTSVYRIGDKSASLNAANNTSQTAKITGVKADENGSVLITINASGGVSTFGYIGALVIESYNATTVIEDVPSGLAARGPVATTGSTSTQTAETPVISTQRAVVEQQSSIMETEVSAFPNPFDDVVSVKVKLKAKSSKLTLMLSDMSGRVIYTKPLGDVSEGEYIYKLSLNSLGLQKGMYILSMRGEGVLKSVKLMKR
ncbi:MAG: T9SS type A sorting domain-containing protein [Chitinophagaceae bacterium]|nr:MAG: T9SS type A sorting domain-containing protein [Chitinophagaceae bacterium]